MGIFLSPVVLPAFTPGLKTGELPGEKLPTSDRMNGKRFVPEAIWLVKEKRINLLGPFSSATGVTKSGWQPGSAPARTWQLLGLEAKSILDR